jgi:hypothetical protein
MYVRALLSADECGPESMISENMVCKEAGESISKEGRMEGTLYYGKGERPRESVETSCHRIKHVFRP